MNNESINKNLQKNDNFLKSSKVAATPALFMTGNKGNNDFSSAYGSKLGAADNYPGHFTSKESARGRG